MGWSHSSSRLPTLADLLRLAPDALAGIDIAIMNLLCASRLPGAEGLDIPVALAKLDHWSRLVRRYDFETHDEFRRNPEEYSHQIGFARFLSIVTVLKHPKFLGLRYQPLAIGNYDFSDSRDDLLHGLLTRGMGTCASFPVLFVAIGRRLGWPMHLAVAKHHIFCQWLNPDGTHANLEGSCRGGGNMPSDESFHTKPQPLTKAELATGRYLRPLTPSEELAQFLEIRGHCLMDNRRFDEAREAYAQARHFAPRWSQYEGHLQHLQVREKRSRMAVSFQRRPDDPSPRPPTQAPPLLNLPRSTEGQPSPAFLFPEVSYFSAAHFRPI